VHPLLLFVKTGESQTQVMGPGLIETSCESQTQVMGPGLIETSCKYHWYLYI